VFNLIRSWRRDRAAVLCAFDLPQRRLPIENRKVRLVRRLRKPSRGIAWNEYSAGDGSIVFAQARLRGFCVEAT
jgi:hypothetical protein